MRNLLVFRVGTGRDGEPACYAAMEGTELVEMYMTPDDDSALVVAERLADGGTIETELGLAEAAGRRGYLARPLSAGEAGDRAHLAIGVYAEDTFADIRNPGVLLDFFHAAFGFERVFCSEEAPELWLRAQLRGTIGSEPAGAVLGIVIAPGKRPALYAAAAAQLEAALAQGRELWDIDRFGVAFMDEPEPLRIALEQAYSLRGVATPFLVSRSHRMRVDEPFAEEIAGLLTATARYQALGDTTTSYPSHLGGTLEIALHPWHPASEPPSTRS